MNKKKKYFFEAAIALVVLALVLPGSATFANNDDPILEIIVIEGGLGVSAIVKNTGNADATDVLWNISVTGGILKLIDVAVEDTLAGLAVDEESEPLKTGLFFGLGKIAIDVTVTCDEGFSDSETATGMQIIIFTRVNE